MCAGTSFAQRLQLTHQPRWEGASNDQAGSPDVVMACAADVPTLETLAAASYESTYQTSISA